MRPIARELVRDLKKAKPDQVDAVVKRFMKEKAQRHATMIARSESIEAYKQSYRKSTEDQDWTKGYRWSLGAGHPKPDECLPEGTLVETASGPRPIEEIVPGDLVLTHRGRYRGVLGTRSTAQEVTLCELAFDARRPGSNQRLHLSATPNHPVLTDRGWVAVCDLKVGGAVYSQRQPPHLDRSAHDTNGKGASGSLRSLEAATDRQSSGRVLHDGCLFLTPDKDSTEQTSPFPIAASASAPGLTAESHRRASLRSQSHDGLYPYMPESNIGALSWTSSPRRTGRTDEQLATLPAHLGTPHNKPDHKSDGDLFSGESLAGDIGHMFCISTLSSVEYSTTFKVWNLAIEEDESYVAGGIVVHNCDILAGQNLYGLGPGGYPVDEVPDTPHPNDLCVQVAIIDTDHFKREKAIRNKEKPPPEPWKKGKPETSEHWLKKQSQSKQKQILGPTKYERFKRQPAGVLGKDGIPRRVKDLHRVRSAPAQQRFDPMTGEPLPVEAETFYKGPLKQGMKRGAAEKAIRGGTTEHGAFFDKDGTLVARVGSGTDQGIAIPESIKREIRKRGATSFVHNHPDKFTKASGVLSPGDIKFGSEMRLNEVKAISTRPAQKLVVTDAKKWAKTRSNIGSLRFDEQLAKAESVVRKRTMKEVIDLDLQDGAARTKAWIPRYEKELTKAWKELGKEYGFVIRATKTPGGR